MYIYKNHIFKMYKKNSNITSNIAIMSFKWIFVSFA